MINEVGNLQQVASLCIHRATNFLDESRSIVGVVIIIGKISPCWVNFQLLVLTTTINSSVVQIDYVLTLLAIALYDECLHLLNSQFQRNNLCNAEECRLKDCIGAVAQTNFLCYLSSVDIVNGNIVLSEVTLYLVRDKVDQFLTIEDSIQQESTILTQTTCYIVHIQVSLNVASNEVWSLYLIGRTDLIITETKMRTSETTRFLRVVREVSLAILIGVITNNLNRVLVSTYSTIGTKTIELSLKSMLTT